MRVMHWDGSTDQERTTGKPAPRVVRVVFEGPYELEHFRRRIDELLALWKGDGKRHAFRFADISLAGREHHIEVVLKD